MFEHQKNTLIDKQSNTSTCYTKTQDKQKTTTTPNQTQTNQKLEMTLGASQSQPHLTLQQSTPPFFGPFRKRRASLYPLQPRQFQPLAGLVQLPTNLLNGVQEPWLGTANKRPFPHPNTSCRLFVLHLSDLPCSQTRTQTLNPRLLHSALPVLCCFVAKKVLGSGLAAQICRVNPSRRT